MKSRPPFSLKLTVLLGLFFISSALAKAIAPSLLAAQGVSTIKPLTDENENVLLFKDNVGFFVAVDLLYDPASSYSVPMSLSFYTYQTLLVSDCFKFKSYDCEKYHCTPNPINIDVRNYFSFTAHSYWAGTNLYVNYDHWGGQVASVIATSCEGNPIDSYGQRRYGILGMGTSFAGKSHYNASKPIFSVWIADDMKLGELVFKKDLYHFAESATPVAVLKANLDWVSTFSGTIEIGEKSIDMNVDLIFDISSDSIGLPVGIYNQVIENLSGFGVKDCTAGSTYQPLCTYKGKYEDLPNITLVSGNTKVVIPPKVYVLASVDRTSVTLNLKGLSNALTGNSFVTKSYDNCIVLDAKFMNYYYTVFEYQNEDGSTITLYKSGKGAVEPDDGDGGYWWIVVVVLLVVIAIGCVAVLLRKKTRSERESIENESVHTPFNVNERGN